MQFFIDLWNSVYNFLLARFQSILIFTLILIGGAILIKILMGFFRRKINGSKIKGTAGDFLISCIKVVLLAIYFIALLAMLGVPTTSMIAILSAFALAVSLALQNTFANVAAGIVIVTTKPFEEGDFVDIDGTSGTVETITVFNTKLVTGDNKAVILPNSTVSAANITNYSAKETRRLDLTFSASYDVPVAKVKEVIHGVLAKHDEILQSPAPLVRLKEHGDSTLNYVVRVWLSQKDYWNVNFALLEEMVEAFAENGIEVPYNTMNINVLPAGKEKAE